MTTARSVTFALRVTLSDVTRHTTRATGGTLHFSCTGNIEALEISSSVATDLILGSDIHSGVRAAYNGLYLKTTA